MENILITSYSHRQAGRPPSSHSYVVFQGIKRKDVGAVLNRYLQRYWPIYETGQAYPCLVLKKKAESEVNWGSVQIIIKFGESIVPRVSLRCLHTGFERTLENLDHYLETALPVAASSKSCNFVLILARPYEVTLKPWSISIKGVESAEMFWISSTKGSQIPSIEQIFVTKSLDLTCNSLKTHLEYLFWLEFCKPPQGTNHGQNLATFLDELLDRAQTLMSDYANNSIPCTYHKELWGIIRPVLDLLWRLTKDMFDMCSGTGGYLENVLDVADLPNHLPTQSELDEGGSTAYDKKPHFVEFWTYLHNRGLTEWFRRFYSEEEIQSDLVLSVLAFRPVTEPKAEDDLDEGDEEEDQIGPKNGDPIATWLLKQGSLGQTVHDYILYAFGTHDTTIILQKWRSEQIPENVELETLHKTLLKTLCTASFWTDLKSEIFAQHPHQSLVFTQHGELLHTSSHHSICRKYQHFYLIAAHQEVFVWNTQTKSKSAVRLPVDAKDTTSINSFLVSNAQGYIEATLADDGKSSEFGSDEDDGPADSVIQTFYRGFLPSLRTRGAIVFRKYEYADSKKGSIWSGRHWALSFRTHEGLYGYLFKSLNCPQVKAVPPPSPTENEPSEDHKPAAAVGFFKFPDDPNKDSNPELCRGMIATVYWMKSHFMVILQCKASQYCVVDLFREVSATQPPERRETIAIDKFFQVPYNEDSREAQSNCCAFIKKGYGVILRIFDDLKYSIFLMDLKNWNRVYQHTQRTISRNTITAPVSVSQEIIDNAFKQKSGYTIRYHEDCGSKGVQLFTRWGYLSNPGCDQLWYNKYLFIP